jgi:ribosomal protein S18 acetylase RimI-like enzyme
MPFSFFTLPSGLGFCHDLVGEICMSDAVKTCGANAVRSQFSAPPEVETVSLRRATADDAAMLAVVGTATFLEAYTWALPGADIVDFCIQNHTAEAYARYLAKPETRITLAVTGDDAPVGYVMICEPDLPGFDLRPADTELKRIYLFSRYRPGGNGQRLMDAAIADARERGCRRMLLGTNAGNARAIAFYRRNGFTEVGSRTFVVGVQHCCDVIFGREL